MKPDETPGERPVSASMGGPHPPSFGECGSALSPLVVVAGPTASGKSSLALALALRFGGEIISCDSVAVYREFEIGTAKPGSEERALVPHHLIDVIPPDAYFSAGQYARLARAAASQITARGHLPIVCGGTGLYLRAMLDGLFAGPERDEPLRERLRRRKRPVSLWRLLRRLDPEAAARIHANDEPKLIRAIEVCAASARPMSDLLRHGRDPIQGYRVLRLGLSPQRSALYDRINRRCAEMFAQGLVEETRGLLERYGPEVFAMRSLGYRQAAEHLRGESSLAEAVARAQQGHRNYAKRQLTWFRRDTEMQWLENFGLEAATHAQEAVRRFIALPNSDPPTLE
jgi:tRNA dimethylallyltransferase